jgi:hypothetical protein
MGNFQGFRWCRPVRVYPFTRNIGHEDIRPIKDAMPGVDAPPGIEPYRDLFSPDYFLCHVPGVTAICYARC